MNQTTVLWIVAARAARALPHAASRPRSSSRRRLRAATWRRRQSHVPKDSEQHDAFSVSRRRSRGVRDVAPAARRAQREARLANVRQARRTGDQLRWPGRRPDAPQPESLRATRGGCGRLQTNAADEDQLLPTIEPAIRSWQLRSCADVFRPPRTTARSRGISQGRRHRLRVPALSAGAAARAMRQRRIRGPGAALARLGMPELALGDAYRAIIAGRVRPPPITRSAPCCWPSASGEQRARRSS